MSAGDKDDSSEARDAQAYVRAWAQRSGELERLRLLALRALTDADAGQRFALLVSGATLPTRRSSGLVEQQRILARLSRSSR